MPVPGDPKIHTSVLLRTTPELIGWLNFFTAAQLLPLKRRTWPLNVKAHTLLAEEDAAAWTKSPALAGKARDFQVDPLSW